MSLSLGSGFMPQSLYGYQNPMLAYGSGYSQYFPSPYLNMGYNPMMGISPWSNSGLMNYSSFNSSGLNSGFDSFNNNGFDRFNSSDSGSGMLNQIYSMMSMLRMMQLYQAQNTARTTGTLPNNARVINQPNTLNQVAKPVNTVATNGNVVTATNPTTVAPAAPVAPIAEKTVIKGNSVVLGRDLLTKVAQNPNQAVTFVRQELEKLAGSDKSWQVVNLFRTVPTTHKHGGKEDKALQPLLAKLAQAAIDQSKALGLTPTTQTVTTKTI